MESTSSSSSVVFAVWLRNVWAVVVVVCVCSTLTGCVRILPTSSSRSFWWIHSTKPSDVTPRPTGSATLSTSTARCVA
uniref:Conotoxin n=1 Tax=Conus betulinus TaxID=89764 RepID=A0A1P7ZCS7_CONBE|nr:Conotoxin [Conus betulinus]